MFAEKSHYLVYALARGAKEKWRSLPGKYFTSRPVCIKPGKIEGMPTKSLSMLWPLILVWVVSGLAGISFLRTAYSAKTLPPVRGWRAFLRELHFRLSFAAGVGLILFVILGVAWVVLN